MKYSSYNTAGAGLPRDLVCLSHLRWGFVYQRPQHLLSRFARDHRVFFVEEPVPTSEATPHMKLHVCPESGVNIVVPQMPEGIGPSQETILKLLLTNLLAEQRINDYILWYYTPMAIGYSRHLEPAITVFDCMDELSAFKNAPQEMKDREAAVLRRADVVFTGGQSLYEAKRDRHANAHCFPSSIDYNHFAQARSAERVDPADQANIPHPRIGYCGVIDERMDLELLRGMAELRPNYQFVMLGPVVKISNDSLPQLPNIHYLGGKSYKELPAYLGGWDVTMLPFAHNESTRFISPTKTPEYLAGGRPVVSTSITDVVRPYGVQKLVRIADTAPEFATAIDAAMREEVRDPEWLARVDAMLAGNSWDLTWQSMRGMMRAAAAEKALRTPSQHLETEVAPVFLRPTAALGD